MSDIPRDPRAPPQHEEVDGEIEEIDDALPGEGDEAELPDGEGEGDADPDGEEEAETEEVDEPPAPRRGGGSQAIRQQRARAQAAERELAEERRQRQEDRQRLQHLEQRITQDPQAAARAEQEWLASIELMTPAQQAQAVIQRGRQEFGQAFQQLQFQSNDRLDKQAYDAQARINPIFKKYAPDVERVLASERAAGRNPDREDILNSLYGREMRQRAERAAPAQRRAGAARGAAQRTQPTGARSTVAAGSRRPAPGSIEADEALINAAIARGEQVF